MPIAEAARHGEVVLFELLPLQKGVDVPPSITVGIIFRVVPKLH